MTEANPGILEPRRDKVMKNNKKKKKIITDPQGSYTGKPADNREKPVQDVDDL